MIWSRVARSRERSTATGAAGAAHGGSVRIEGAAELDAKLRELPRAVENKIRRKALRAGAKPILAAAKQIAPKKTGTLRRSLKVKAGKGRKGYIRFYVQTKDGDYRGDTFYGAFLEFGHKIGSRKLATKERIGTEKRRTGQRGRSKGIYKQSDKRQSVPPFKFLEPAFKRQKDAALKAIIATTKSGIESAAKRAPTAVSGDATEALGL